MTGRATHHAGRIVAAATILNAATLLAAAAPARAADETEAAVPDLSGKWKLDEKASDDGRGGWQEREGGPGGGRGGHGGPGGGMGGPGGEMGGPGGGMGRPGGGGGHGGPEVRTPPPPEWREHVRRVLFGAKEVEVATTAADASFRYADGTVRSLPTDGTWRAVSGVASEERAGSDEKVATNVLESRASWDGARLVVDTRVKGGPSSKEDYELSSDGNTLTQLVRLQGGRMPGRGPVLRVYRRSTGSDAGVTAPAETAPAAEPPAPADPSR